MFFQGSERVSFITRLLCLTGDYVWHRNRKRKRTGSGRCGHSRSLSVLYNPFSETTPRSASSFNVRYFMVPAQEQRTVTPDLALKRGVAPL
jgi:hypothetical protein